MISTCTSRLESPTERASRYRLHRPTLIPVTSSRHAVSSNVYFGLIPLHSKFVSYLMLAKNIRRKRGSTVIPGTEPKSCMGQSDLQQRSDSERAVWHAFFDGSAFGELMNSWPLWATRHDARLFLKDRDQLERKNPLRQQNMLLVQRNTLQEASRFPVCRRGRYQEPQKRAESSLSASR